MKRKKALIILIPIALVMMLILSYIFYFRVPVKHAVKIENVGQYPDSILVRETWHTGTGWEQVGDSTGFFEDALLEDVNLAGNIPPTISSGGDGVNTYLCRVQLMGSFTIVGDNTPYDEYYVLEWYPVYPIKRDTLLPSWLFSDAYLSRWDMNSVNN